ncbi:MAG: HEAT repeat domain-containing protein [Pirellulales bacterium]
MKRHLLQFALVILLPGIMVALIGGSPLCAQEPFGDFGAPAAAVEQADEIQAPGDAEAKQPAAPADPAKPAEPPPDPAQYSLPIRAVLESNPQTPVQLVRAASVLIDFGEPALARRYVVKLQQASLDDAALADLVRRLGSGPFLRIAGETALEPVGREFGDRAIGAASQAARDPKRLAQFVEQLGNPAPEAQRRAIAELLDAHEFAVPPLLAAINDPARKSVHARAQQALVALRQDAVLPLLAVLDGPDSAAKAAAVESLGRIGAAEATGPLVGLYASRESRADVRAAAEQAILDLHGKTPTPREAAIYLERETRAVLSGQRRLPTKAGGNVEAWIWDPAKGVPIPATLSEDQARSRLALHLAHRLYELSSNNRQYRRHYLVSMLAAEVYRVGRDNPVPRDKDSAFTQAAAMGVTAVEHALSDALDHGHAAAATIAAQVLGEVGDSALLVRGGEPTPLARALTHDDRRLRFAAAEAIVNLMPAAHFAGSSHLKSALVSFATSSGERRAVVGFPNVETVGKLAGMVNSLGFDSATATNGRELLLQATKAGDNELILISSRIDRGPLYLVLQDLRNHAHTAETPIIVLAEDDELGELRDGLEDDPLTRVVLRPRDVEGMRYAVDSVLRRAGERIVPPAVRERQAKEALRSIAALNTALPKIFDFRDYETELSRLLYSPSLGALAAEVIDDFGTHASQQALLTIINRTSQPLASRQAATIAFGESVRRFGVRLKKDEILRQYARYNASEFEDGASQELLGAVLDAIELPTRKNGE